MLVRAAGAGGGQQGIPAVGAGVGAAFFTDGDDLTHPSSPSRRSPLWSSRETHLFVVRAGGGETEDEEALRHDRHYTALRLALLARKRATVLRSRDDNEIDDTVLRQVQRQLDIEEVRLSRRRAVD